MINFEIFFELLKFEISCGVNWYILFQIKLSESSWISYKSQGLPFLIKCTLHS